MKPTNPFTDRSRPLDQTAFAWRQTSLAIGASSLVMVHLLPGFTHSLGWMAPGMIGMLFAAWLWYAGERRSRAFARAMMAPTGHSTPDGRPLLALIVFTWCAAAASIAVMFWLHH